MCGHESEIPDIYLRPMTKEDTDLIISWRNTDVVRKRFIDQAPFTREGHLNWIATMVDTGRVVQKIICMADTGRPVGSVYVRDIDLRHGKGEYGIFIGEADARGKGIGTRAARLMLEYCFGELKLHKVFLRAFADNIQAIRSYEKAGFIKEGYLREDVCIEGNYRDIVLMAVLNPGGSGKISREDEKASRESGKASGEG